MSLREEKGCPDPSCFVCYPNRANTNSQQNRSTPFMEKITREVGGSVGGMKTDPQHLPSDAKERKGIPIATGVVDYFPDALVAVARLSQIGNDQHNPGQPLHWSRGKSTDHSDTLIRHFVDRGTIDTDGVRHSAKVAWRALAILQLEIEAARNADLTSPAGKSAEVIKDAIPEAYGPWFRGEFKRPIGATDQTRFQFRVRGMRAVADPRAARDLTFNPDCEYREVRS